MEDSGLEPLVRHTVQAVRAGKVGVRELVNIAYGAARSIKGESLRELFAAVEGQLMLRANELNARDLSMVTWSFAKVGWWSDMNLTVTLAWATERHVDSFSVQ